MANQPTNLDRDQLDALIATACNVTREAVLTGATAGVAFRSESAAEQAKTLLGAAIKVELNPTNGKPEVRWAKTGQVATAAELRTLLQGDEYSAFRQPASAPETKAATEAPSPEEPGAGLFDREPKNLGEALLQREHARRAERQTAMAAGPVTLDFDRALATR